MHSLYFTDVIDNCWHFCCFFCCLSVTVSDVKILKWEILQVLTNVPSWCDRVLRHSFPQTKISCTSYGGCDIWLYLRGAHNKECSSLILCLCPFAFTDKAIFILVLVTSHFLVPVLVISSCSRRLFGSYQSCRALDWSAKSSLWVLKYPALWRKYIEFQGTWYWATIRTLLCSKHVVPTLLLLLNLLNPVVACETDPIYSQFSHRRSGAMSPFFLFAWVTE